LPYWNKGRHGCGSSGAERPYTQSETSDLLDSSSFWNASIRRFEELEGDIHALFPCEQLRGKADPVLRDALEKYANEVWDVAHSLPPPENAAALISSTQTLAPHPIFILGVHRSGTTLMQRLLDHHHELMVLPAEGTYLTNLYPRLRRMDEKAGLAYLVQRWIPRLINPNNQPPYWTLGRTQRDYAPYLAVARNALYLAEHARSLFDRHGPFQPHLAFIMAVHGARHDSQVGVSKKYWVDKTPLNECYVARLQAAFPEAKFIHMVRDPRAIFASRKKLYLDIFGTSSRALRFVYKIGKSLRLALQNQAQLGQAAYHIVRYEDVLRDLSGEMASLRTFLGIADHETLLQPTSSGIPCVANSSYHLPFTAGQVQNHSEIYYQQILSPVEHELIEGFTGGHARALGYPLKSRGWIFKTTAAARYVLTKRLQS
jgi:hypothetical protein